MDDGWQWTIRQIECLPRHAVAGARHADSITERVRVHMLRAAPRRWTSKELALELDTNRRTVQSGLRRLMDAGIVRRSIDEHGIHWWMCRQ